MQRNMLVASVKLRFLKFRGAMLYGLREAKPPVAIRRDRSRAGTDKGA
jgi:hypothetical protein